MPLRASPSRRPRLPMRSGARGIVMIEILVALLIFMLGILGFIGMQTALTKEQSEANLRATAANLANDVMGRMWANIGNLAGYTGTDSCSATPCTEWRSKVQEALPAGTASIKVDAATGNVSIKLGWTLPGGVTHQYETQSNISAKTAS
ncbi:MAG: type IV pilus modification protein PilV [Proteobacteria bacterium]|nr:type IV pilus modification protein PilV [Pseudomonadota bacterium]